jgi:drug/metabolite transporter (DMT)-like permease
MTGAVLAASPRALFGDLLALAGGALAAGYVTVGERVRTTLSTTVYTSICYGVCSIVLLIVCLLADVRLGGYDAKAWLLLVAVTAGPQFLGHSLLNWVLDAVSATVVSVAILFEVPGAALLALVFLHQSPPLLAVPGIALLMAGLILVVLDMRSSRPTEVVS